MRILSAIGNALYRLVARHDFPDEVQQDALPESVEDIVSGYLNPPGSLEDSGATRFQSAWTWTDPESGYPVYELNLTTSRIVGGGRHAQEHHTVVANTVGGSVVRTLAKSNYRARTTRTFHPVPSGEALEAFVDAYDTFAGYMPEVESAVLVHEESKIGGSYSIDAVIHFGKPFPEDGMSPPRFKAPPEMEAQKIKYGGIKVRISLDESGNPATINAWDPYRMLDRISHKL
ncbi:MAG: hypothetical protein ABH879_01095 [archaeon]